MYRAKRRKQKAAKISNAAAKETIARLEQSLRLARQKLTDASLDEIDTLSDLSESDMEDDLEGAIESEAQKKDSYVAAIPNNEMVDDEEEIRVSFVHQRANEHEDDRKQEKTPEEKNEKVKCAEGEHKDRDEDDDDDENEDGDANALQVIVI